MQVISYEPDFMQTYVFFLLSLILKDLEEAFSIYVKKDRKGLFSPRCGFSTPHSEV